METMTFRELVKMIHPDLNPEVTEPGSKMAMAKRHRDNPSYLFSLAVRWGLIKGNGNTSDTRTDYTTNDNYNNDLIFTCGNEVVFYTRRRQQVFAIIVDIVKGKGRRSHQHKVFVVDSYTGKLYHFFLTNLNTSIVGNVRVTRKSDSTRVEAAKRTYRRYQESIERHKQFKKETKKRREQEVKKDLCPNINDYWNENIWIVPKTIRAFLRVTRTTAKRVYYWDERLQKERFVNMSSVIRVIKRETE